MCFTVSAHPRYGTKRDWRVVSVTGHPHGAPEDISERDPVSVWTGFGDESPPKVAWHHLEGKLQSFSTHLFPAVFIECGLPGCSSGSLLAFRQDLSDALLLVNPRRDELRQREVCVVVRNNVG